jgi:hypothetical protein
VNMKRKRMINDAVGLAGTGMIVGIGAQLPGAGPSMQAFGSMMPAMGTAMGGGYAIGAMKDMVPKKRRKR